MSCSIEDIAWVTFRPGITVFYKVDESGEAMNPIMEQGDGRIALDTKAAVHAVAFVPLEGGRLERALESWVQRSGVFDEYACMRCDNWMRYWEDVQEHIGLIDDDDDIGGGHVYKRSGFGIA